MAKVTRILVPIDSRDPQSWAMALACAEQINKTATPPVGEVVLLLHVKDLLSHTSLAGFSGEAHAKRLKAGQPLKLASGAALRVEAPRTLSLSFGRTTTIISFYADNKILEHVDGLKNVAGVVAVPEFPGDADEWKARWGPIVPGEAPSAPIELIKHPVIFKALELLSGLVDKSNGLLTAPYKDSANDILRILLAKGISLRLRTLNPGLSGMAGLPAQQTI